MDEANKVNPTNEPAALRWKRRAVTIPAMLGATTLAMALFPMLFVGALIYDFVRLRFRPAVLGVG
jgi:hypothetical protein